MLKIGLVDKITFGFRSVGRHASSKLKNNPHRSLFVDTRHAHFLYSSSEDCVYSLIRSRGKLFFFLRFEDGVLVAM